MQFKVQVPDNYEQKCLCVLVLDTSSSMSGQPIEELNNGLQVFRNEVLNDYLASQRLEVCIIAFNSGIHCVQEPALAANFLMPVLAESGTTRLVDAVRAGMEQVERRKQYYKQTGQTYYRPFIVLITDGEPDPDQDIAGLSRELKQAVADKKFNFYAVGVQGANLHILNHISPPNTPPLMLQGLRFAQFFKWLSSSMSMIAHSRAGDKIALPPVSGWAQIDS